MHTTFIYVCLLVSKSKNKNSRWIEWKIFQGSFKNKKEKKKHMKWLNFITQFKIKFLLLFTGCRKVLGKMPASVTEDIEIWKSYMNALLSRHQYLCFSPMESSPKAMTISCPRLADKESFSILNSNSYLEMLWKEICLVGPVNCFSLNYFIVVCFSFHCTSHYIF